jgi:hypothetical protein
MPLICLFCRVMYACPRAAVAVAVGFTIAVAVAVAVAMKSFDQREAREQEADTEPCSAQPDA